MVLLFSACSIATATTAPEPFPSLSHTVEELGGIDPSALIVIERGLELLPERLAGKPVAKGARIEVLGVDRAVAILPPESDSGAEPGAEAGHGRMRMEGRAGGGKDLVANNKPKKTHAKKRKRGLVGGFKYRGGGVEEGASLRRMW